MRVVVTGLYSGGVKEAAVAVAAAPVLWDWTLSSLTAEGVPVQIWVVIITSAHLGDEC